MKWTSCNHHPQPPHTCRGSRRPLSNRTTQGVPRRLFWTSCRFNGRKDLKSRLFHDVCSQKWQPNDNSKFQSGKMCFKACVSGACISSWLTWPPFAKSAIGVCVCVKFSPYSRNDTKIYFILEGISWPLHSLNTFSSVHCMHRCKEYSVILCVRVRVYTQRTIPHIRIYAPTKLVQSLQAPKP